MKRTANAAKFIRCPACNASGAICSTCGGKRFIADDGVISLLDMTETPEEWERVNRDLNG